MMQMRDWAIGAIGVVIGAIGLLSLIGILPFSLPRSVLVWISAVAILPLAYAALVEITNSNILGKITLGVAGVTLIVSVFPALNSAGILGAWAEFSWLGEMFYKAFLLVQGFFLGAATFGMEL